MNDRCPICKGKLHVYRTRVVHGVRQRWLKCADCGHCPPRQEEVTREQLAKSLAEARRLLETRKPSRQ